MIEAETPLLTTVKRAVLAQPKHQNAGEYHDRSEAQQAQIAFPPRPQTDVRADAVGSPLVMAYHCPRPPASLSAAKIAARQERHAPARYPQRSPDPNPRRG